MGRERSALVVGAIGMERRTEKREGSWEVASGLSSKEKTS